MKLVAGWYLEVVQVYREMQIFEFSYSAYSEVSRKTLCFASHIKILGAPVCECLNHSSNVMRHVTNVNK